MDLEEKKESLIEFESEEKMFFKKISESKYPKVAVGKLRVHYPRQKVMPSKNLEEKDVESELEKFYKDISESSYPKIVLKKLK
ncbi:hypothetical protein Avbf_00103 [Armadillidium vulgare]|nr:hypothetical protein Avbf_00103 [Armadillidium vulgare]